MNIYADIIIRKAEYEDVATILDIMNEAHSLLENKKMFFTDDKEFIENGIEKRGFALIAEDGAGKSVAYITVRFPELDGDNLLRYLSADNEQLMKVAMLDSVAVKPGYRGQGLQKRLIEEADKIAKERGYVHFVAKTHPDNRASLKSFLSRGYRYMLKVHEYGSERVILYKSIYEDEKKEYFALFDKNGNALERIKERNAVHRDGDLHGGAHIWIMGRYEKTYVSEPQKNNDMDTKKYNEEYLENGEIKDALLKSELNNNEISERSIKMFDEEIGESDIEIMNKRNNTNQYGIKVLLQKRSDDKDSFPGCYDCSCAGHVDAGERFVSTALRELKEELGIEADAEDLEFLFKQFVGGEYEFYGEAFKNYEVNHVYLLKKPVDIEKLVFQKEEIQGLEWQDAYEVLEKIRESDNADESGYCIWEEEFEKVLRYVSMEAGH